MLAGRVVTLGVVAGLELGSGQVGKHIGTEAGEGVGAVQLLDALHVVAEHAEPLQLLLLGGVLAAVGGLEVGKHALVLLMGSGGGGAGHEHGGDDDSFHFQ